MSAARILLPVLPLETVAECSKCKRRWKVFKAASPLLPQSFVLIDTDRTEEFLGNESRQVDNSKSAAEMTRRFTIGREWAQSYVVDYERIQNRREGLQLGSPQFATLTLAAENALKERYSITTETKQSYSEEISVNVPPKTKLNIVFHWKRIWQHGLLQTSDLNGRAIEIPFKVAVGVTFDQTQS